MKINTQLFNTVASLLLGISLFHSLLVTPDQDEKKRIIFFGDSITAGYGLSMEQAFPALIQEKLDSSALDYRVINAGLSGETSAGGLSRIDWILKAKPDIFVLELGGNDGLRGLSLDETEKNLTTMIKKVRDRNPEVTIIVAGMQIPPNLGQEYTERFKTLFADVAKANQTHLIPFLLVNVGGEPDLNLPDGIHPNVTGHKIVAETVWQSIKPFLD